MRCLAFAMALCVMTASAAAESEESSTRQQKPSSPQASRKATAREVSNARRLFELGKQAIHAGRFESARRYFEQALALVPRASTAFNLAVAYRGVGMPREALLILGGLERADFGPIPAQRREQVHQLMAEARREVGRLSIRTEGAPTAEIRVDGKLEGSLEESRPLLVDVNPGNRVVTVSSRGRRTVERRVVVAPGQTSKVVVLLERAPDTEFSTLVVQTSAPADVVEIVGIARAQGRVSRKLAPGRYRVRVTSANATRQTWVVLSSGSDKYIELEPAARSVFRSPWFWIGAGAVLSAATVAGFWAARDRTSDPVSDPEFQITQTLRLPRP